jgi:hypothetical protein
MHDQTVSRTSKHIESNRVLSGPDLNFTFMAMRVWAFQNGDDIHLQLKQHGYFIVYPDQVHTTTHVFKRAVSMN